MILGKNRFDDPIIQKDNIEKIEQLQRLHKLTDSFPVWPYDFGTLRRFVITIGSPVYTIALSIIINFLGAFIFGQK